MDEREEGTGATVIELMLREPEIVAWLGGAEARDEDDDDPPRAA